MAWDAFVDVRGNRYTVPDAYAGRLVTIRVDFEDRLTILDGERVLIEHRLPPSTLIRVEIRGTAPRLSTTGSLETSKLAKFS